MNSIFNFLLKCTTAIVSTLIFIAFAIMLFLPIILSILVHNALYLLLYVAFALILIGLFSDERNK